MTRRIRITLLAGAGFLCLQLGWILALAPHFGIDEFDHALRASSVASGHWEPGDNLAPETLGRGDLIPVRTDVAESIRTACDTRPYTKVYDCQPSQDLGNGESLIASGAARYNPTFYAVVGIAAAPFHGTANLYALRIATALFACALLMLTVWLVAGRARTRWPVVAVVLAALPTTVYSTSIATPNGVEMIAGLGIWVAMLAVADPSSDGRHRRAAYLALALFTCVLINLHTLGVVWLALIGIAVAMIHGPVTAVRSLWPQTLAERVTIAVTGFAGAFEITWVLVSRTNDPSSARSVIPGSPVGTVLNGLLLWPLQAIGAYPMRDNMAPMAVYPIVLVVLVAFAVLALRRTRLRSRAALAFGFVALMSLAVPAAMTVATYAQLGSAWQGRYGMPFTVGLLVLAGRQLELAERPAPRARALAYVAALAIVFAHVISQVSLVTQQRAIAGLAAGTHWSPPGPALLVALAVLAALCWTRALSYTPRDGSDPAAGSGVPDRNLQEVAA